MGLLNLLTKVTSSPLFPNQDTMAGGLAGIAAFFLTAMFKLDPAMSSAIVGGAITLVSHYTPLSVKDKIKEADAMVIGKGGEVVGMLIKANDVMKALTIKPSTTVTLNK